MAASKKEEPIIEVKHLSKQYNIGMDCTYKTFCESFTSAVRHPLKTLKDCRMPNDTFWALKDVNFEIEKGDVVGIIGSNGAGKSTLLKILSRITYPTEGEITMRGRVGSLLEVGTGFHPELTGRENIYFNGAILGMKKREIDDKFDEIVKFAEVEKFLDTPVKRYSSGMNVRLAFSVAAHLDPEVLVVDEVLAVGDMEFQKKCIGKMSEAATDGRTVLFVSHNMGAIKQLCTKGILLNSGSIFSTGSVDEVVQDYLQKNNGDFLVDKMSFTGTLTSHLEFKKISINDIENSNNIYISPSSGIKIKIWGECKRDIPNFRTTFSIYKDGVRLLTLHDVENPEPLHRGEFKSEVEIPPYLLRPGEYSIAIGGHRDGMFEWIWGIDLAFFNILEEWGSNYDQVNFGLVNLPYSGKRTFNHQ